MRANESGTIPFSSLERILLRGTNWIGDVVMTLPAIRAVRRSAPRARITILVKPWVADLLRICPDVDEVMIYESPGIHGGLQGKWHLAQALKKRDFQAAVLLQNAIEAAILARLAGIPVRGGYDTDGRRLLLTHPVRRTKEILKRHQIHYYVEMVGALGCTDAGRDIRLSPGPNYGAIAKNVLGRYGMKEDAPLLGIAPGATYGPAKMWLADRFALAADRLAADFGLRTVLFGSRADRPVAEAVARHGKTPMANLAGTTTLEEAMAVLSRCRLFLSNDSGLMHLAGAFGIPLVAVFGSTNPRTTSPVGEKSVVVTKNVSCSPCLKKTCPTDFRCMEGITVEDVCRAAADLLAAKPDRTDLFR
ncbi:MAG TPA: lipopolysaccharide heptosyltransferase II [Syntrophales bacterium]|nr:lipopolysaccharide heptosyltransferase II [Syntrophales bacterium]HQN78858.1 lipopolysaccharide heptosyltransferase II [Syntrophales bacterium]HQQ27983.1 lipopolysaccharide heptosyltransferase II [Syntrophales bacterium]